MEAIKFSGISGNSGISDLVNKDELVAFPNPTTNLFNVSFKGSSSWLEVKLINTSGSVIYNESIDKFGGRFQKSFDLKTAARGIYFLQIVTNEQVVTRKIVLN